MQMSLKALQVLDLCLSMNGRALSGTKISNELKIGSGTIYPLLARLEKYGLLTSEWEDVNPAEVGRPRKRLYSISKLGSERAMDELAKLRSLDKTKKMPPQNGGSIWV